MELLRRQILNLAVGAATLPVVSGFAIAQTYPTRPVRIVVGFPAAGVSDIAARLIGQWLSGQFHQSFVIENRPGAANNIATEAVIRSAPDGYTLLLVNIGTAINATLYNNLNFNFIRDIVPVASIGANTLVVVVDPSFPVRSLSAFIAYAKANPGRINMASSGTGSLPHIAGELFKIAAGVNMAHVPYRGDGPAIADLLGGHVQVYFSTLPGAIDYVRAGHLIALAVTSATRAEELPDIPAVAELLPSFEANGWVGIGAPKGTPAAIIGRLNGEINAGLADPALKARLSAVGIVARAGSPADFARLIADETEKWGKVIRAADIKPE
jgi:tripartite-type tricarboxylate transporter receptor subunit TctC